MQLPAKRMLIIIGFLIFLFGGIIIFNLIKKIALTNYFAHYEAPPVSVSSVIAVEKDWQPAIKAVGNFVALNGVDVNSQAAGNVVKIHFESGQYFEKNQPLIDLDDSVDQATLKYNMAELELRNLNYKRQTDLLKRGATSGASVDEALSNLSQAQANVEKTQAQIKQKHITTPFAGLLGIRQVNLGQYISPGQTSIVTLQFLDPLYLEFYLPEQLLAKLAVNQQIQFSVEGVPQALFQGKITALNAKVDVNTHNILVQATVPNCPASVTKKLKNSNLIKIIAKPDQSSKIVICNSELNKQNYLTNFAFIPGMFATITVEQPVIHHVVVLPSTAISYSLYGDSVFVIEPDEHGKKNQNGENILRVKRVFVQTGEQSGNLTVITKGIKAGQRVVSSGELKLQNNSPVVINNKITLDEYVDPNELGE